MTRLGAADGVSDRPGSGASYIFGDGKRHATVLITCIGIAERDLAAVVTAIERKLRSFDKRVYLTDTADFSCFVKAGACFEYLPPLADQQKHLPDAPWSAHLRTRYERLTAKWRPSLVVSYGTPIEQFLDGPARAKGAAPDGGS